MTESIFSEKKGYILYNELTKGICIYNLFQYFIARIRLVHSPVMLVVFKRSFLRYTMNTEDHFLGYILCKNYKLQVRAPIWFAGMGVPATPQQGKLF